jgi:voltage-gated potassium channel
MKATFLFRYRKAKQWTHLLLTVGKGETVAKVADWAIAALIVCNVIAVVLGTVDRLFRQYHAVFYAFELLSVGVFTAEYGLRIWAATASERYANPLFGRLRFMVRPEIVIDLLAIVPFYFGALAFASDLRMLRALRLFRFLRLFKLARYSESVERFKRVVRRKTGNLLLAIAGTTILLNNCIDSDVFHRKRCPARGVCEHSGGAVVGCCYADDGWVRRRYPVTPLGKLLGATVAVLGTGLVALPASILASGFIEDDTDPSQCPHCGHEIE